MFLELSGGGVIALNTVQFMWISSGEEHGVTYYYLNVTYSGGYEAAVATFTTLGNLATGLATLIQEIGHPWVSIGDPTTFTSGYAGWPIVAIDFSTVGSFGDGGTGLVIGGLDGAQTLGYAPWVNYAAFEAAMFATFGLRSLTGS